MTKLLDVGQPSVTAEKLASAQGAIQRYRIMAFLTGTVLVLATLVLILKSAGVDHLKPVNAIFWIGHGWFYVIYVLATFALGLKLSWPLARIVLVVLAGTIPTASFFAEHFVTTQAREAANQPVSS